MRIVLAPDSFKESMSADEAVAAMERGVRAAWAEGGPVHRGSRDTGATRDTGGPHILRVPMSDGGEGFTQVIAQALGDRARLCAVTVPDALGRPVRAVFAYDPDERLAVLECAQAVGLEAMARDERDVLASSTVGVGRLIASALDAGAHRIVIGLGGSATNDAGAGMLTALGVRLLDSEADDAAPVEPIPARFGDIVRIDASGLDPRLAQVRIEVAADVTSPLLGRRGASAVFGPQKGASAGQVRRLESALAHFAALAGHAGEGGPAHAPGAGAAGGLGYALIAFCGARIRSGVDVVVELTGLEDAVAGADLVITGEGSIDAQTLTGKAPAGVARVAARAGVPCIALAGRLGAGPGGKSGEGIEELYAHGFVAILPITPAPMGVREALAAGPGNLARATEAAVRLFLAARAST